MKTVLVNRPIHPEAIERLKQEVNVLTPYSASEAELMALLPDVHGILLAMGIKMTSEIIDHCTSLEIIGRHGAGYDIVDVAAAHKKGIVVTNTPYGPTESTAEHAFLLMMAAARHLSVVDRALRNGDFQIRERVVGWELKDKKVGIIGFGRIGKRFGEMCRGAFDMTVYVYDPVVEASEVESWGAVYMPDLLEMARQVDFISVHCPLIPQTHHLINNDLLSAMKSDGILVNAARGPIVDEKALYDALKEKKIAAAGLDVFDQEPPEPDNPLFELDNIILTPHLAAFTDEGRKRMGVTAAEDILRVLRGEPPKYPVKP
jgi:D-3-phosphoglycerate dehydrogenase